MWLEQLRWWVLGAMLWACSAAAWSVTYTSNPTLGQYTTNGTAIRLKLNNSSGGVTPITDGKGRFTAQKIDGSNFLSAELYGLYEGLVQVASQTSSTSSSALTFVYTFPVDFTDGDRLYYVRKVADATINTGSGIRVAAAPDPDSTPPVLSLTGSPQINQGVITGGLTVNDASLLSEVRVDLSRSQTFPSGSFATCSLNADAVIGTRPLYSGTYSFTTKNACPGLTGVAGSTIYYRAYARDNQGNSAFSSTSFFSDPGNQPPTVGNFGANLSANGSLTVNVPVNDLDGNSFYVIAEISNPQGSGGGYVGRTGTRRCLPADCSSRNQSNGTQTLYWSAADLAALTSPGERYRVRVLAYDANPTPGQYESSTEFTMPALPASITAVSPTTVPLGREATFSVAGTNLTSTMGFALVGCSGIAPVAGGTNTAQQFRCTPSSLGNKAGSVTPLSGNAYNFSVSVTDAWPTVSSVAPLSARLDIPTTFTVNGSGMVNGMQFQVNGCRNVQEVAGGTTTRRQFSCVPIYPGSQPMSLSMVAGGANLFPGIVRVEHPARIGNVQARGVPMVGGVSLFNGNLHLAQADLMVPGKGFPFVLSRSFNSYNWFYEAEHGGVSRGAPWRFNTDLRMGFVPNTANTRLFVQKPDGSGENFLWTGSVWAPVDLANFASIRTNADGTWSHIARSGFISTFEAPGSAGRLLKVADRDGNQHTYSYDSSSGRLSQVTDTSGRVYTFTHNSFGQLTQVTDFTGRYVRFTYTNIVGGRIQTVRDVRGNITTYNYNDQGFLESVVDPRGNRALKVNYTTVYGNIGVQAITTAVDRAPAGRSCGGLTEFTYCYTFSAKPDGSGFDSTVDGPLNLAVARVSFDNAGRALSMTDGQNNTAQTQYQQEADAERYALAGLVTQSKTPRGVLENFATDVQLDLTDGLVTGTTDPENHTRTTSWNRNAADNLFTVASQTNALNQPTTFGYTPSGRLNRVTAPQQVLAGSAAATTMAWNGGQLTGITNPLGRSTNFVRDTHGNIVSASDPRNSAWLTTYEYDALGRMTKTTDPLGGVVRTTYDEAGNVTETRRQATGLTDLVTSYLYDANGNRTSTTDPRGNTVTMVYDAGNRLTSNSRAVSGQTTTRQMGYDNASRLVSITNENGNTSQRSYDAASRVTQESLPLSRNIQYTYDADGRIATRTDAAGRVTSYTYDKLGRLTTHSAPGNLITQYTYDAEGRAKTKTDPKGQLTEYSYDANGNLIAVKDPAGVTSTAAYDAANQMTSRTDPRGYTTRFAYDNAGNMTSMTDPLGNIWGYTYDRAGNRTTETLPGGRSNTYVYDGFNRLVQATANNGGTTTQVGYTWDANGNLSQMVDQVGTTTYQYDQANRLIGLTDPFGVSLSYTYDAAGNRKTIVYPGSRTVTYGYDAAERMASVTDWTNRTASYTYNLADQITRLQHGNGSSADYSYDAATGRLSSLINKRPGGEVISSHQHTYDAAGNITQADEVLPLEPTLTPRRRVWAVDAANRVVSESIAGSTFEHDAAGRLVRQVINGEATTFNYNERDLLTAFNGPGRAETYRYNGQGHRLERTVNGAVTRYLVEPNGDMPNVLAEMNGSNAPQRLYVHGATGLLAQIDAAGNYRAYHAAPIGHVLALSNAAGQVTDSYAYLPYGETTATGSTVNPFRFVGKWGVMDEGNGLQFMRARYYSKNINGFGSLDSVMGVIENSPSLNRYSYVSGRATGAIDPTGNQLSFLGGLKESAKGALGEILDHIQPQTPTAATSVSAGRLGDAGGKINANSAYQIASSSWDMWKTASESAKNGDSYGVYSKKILIKTTQMEISAVLSALAVKGCVVMAVGAAGPTMGTSLIVAASCGAVAAGGLYAMGELKSNISDAEIKSMMRAELVLQEYDDGRQFSQDLSRRIKECRNQSNFSDHDICGALTENMYYRYGRDRVDQGIKDWGLY